MARKKSLSVRRVDQGVDLVAVITEDGPMVVRQVQGVEGGIVKDSEGNQFTRSMLRVVDLRGVRVGFALMTTQAYMTVEMLSKDLEQIIFSAATETDGGLRSIIQQIVLGALAVICVMLLIQLASVRADMSRELIALTERVGELQRTLSLLADGPTQLTP